MASLGASVRDGLAPPRPDRSHGPAALPLAGRISRTLIVGLSLMVIATLGLLQVLQTSQLATAGFELRTLQSERTRLESEIRLFEAGIAERSQLGRVLDEAVNGLGMVEPERTLRLTVDEPAPNGVRLPRRYVDPVPAFEEAVAPWWEPLLERIPGFD